MSEGFDWLLSLDDGYDGKLLQTKTLELTVLFNFFDPAG